MALLFTSSSLARSLIRTLLIRPFLSPCVFRSLHPHGATVLRPHAVENRWRESLVTLFVSFHGRPLLLLTALAQRLHCPIQVAAGQRLLRCPPRLRLALQHPRIPPEPAPPRVPGLTLRRSTLPSRPFPQQAVQPRQSPDWQNNYSPLD